MSRLSFEFVEKCCTGKTDRFLLNVKAFYVYKKEFERGHTMKKLIAMLLALLILASLMTGCASKETTPAQDTETKTDAAPADTNSAEETTDAEPTENPYAEQIAECIASFEQEQSAWTEWTGPTTGPKIAEGKKICIINQDSSNGGEALWGD